VRPTRLPWATVRPPAWPISQVVIEIIHGTYGAEGEALEALVSIRPAAGNVIVFETYEGEDSKDDEPAGMAVADTAADR
jgi:hypothetical protein